VSWRAAYSISLHFRHPEVRAKASLEGRVAYTPQQGSASAVVHAFFAIATNERAPGGFPQHGEAFALFEENARNEAAVRTVIELNCGLKSI
jgi:hypothetical protein